MKKILTCILLIAVSLSVITPAYASLTPSHGPDKATIKAALNEFKSLSKKERKERIKNVKKEWKLYNQENKETKKSKVEQIVLIILAILLPPLAVYLHQEEVNGKFWLSLLLWFLFILPGVIYALLVVTDSI